ncbi:DUF262 domain-containing protein [Lactobacillus sp. S2-2]|nr:DUF262 domain-containing protein [Lactobacillus sp. S2-2]
MYTDKDFKLKKSLKIETSNDFFNKYLYGDREKQKICNSTDKSIDDVFTFFEDVFKKENISSYFNENIDYFDILHIIYEQISNFIIGILSTNSDEDATSIFESLNSKGKPLDQSDLIKNKIFSELIEKEPLDKAKNCWNEIKKNLETKTVNDNNFPFTDLDDFINIYWKENIDNTSTNKIYANFKSKIENKEITSEEFLEDLRVYSKEFGIIYGDKSNFHFSKEHWSEIKNYINLLVDDLKIKQTYPILLQIMHCYNLNLIKEKTIIKNLKYMANFHIIYNDILNGKGNMLHYDKHARILRKILMNKGSDFNESKSQIISDKLKDMRKELSGLLPKEKIAFNNALEQYCNDENLSYTNKIDTKNQKKINNKTRNILNNYSILVNNNVSEGTNIEHIYLDSATDDITHSIGNLIILSIEDNSKLSNKRISEKKAYYEKITNNNDVSKLVHSGFFDENNKDIEIKNRKKYMFEEIYNSIKNG